MRISLAVVPLAGLNEWANGELQKPQPSGSELGRIQRNKQLLVGIASSVCLLCPF